MRALAGVLALAFTGCAGMVFSHRPYSIKNPGTVVQASPRVVLTEWPKGRRYFASDGYIAVGDRVDNVCIETVPAVNTQFEAIRLSWNKTRKCWRWENY